eukprot:g26114.t1
MCNSFFLEEKEVEVEVEDEAEVSLQKPAESLEVKAEERVVTSPTHLSEVKPDVHVDAPLAKPPEAAPAILEHSK